MNIFEELQPHLDSFKAVREHVISTATLPEVDGSFSFGKPPFAIDDGTHYYAVIDKDGEVSPLPFGYQVPDEDMETEGVDAVYSQPMSTAVGGVEFVRFVPLVEDFEIPSERAFCLEAAEDSDAWEAVGRIVDAMQQKFDEKAVFNFNQRLSNALVSLYEGCDALESVEQTISALFLDSSVLPTLFLRSCQHAVHKLEEEMSAEEGDDDE